MGRQRGPPGPRACSPPHQVRPGPTRTQVQAQPSPPAAVKLAYPLSSSFLAIRWASSAGQGLTRMAGGRGTAAHLLPWGKGLGGWWTASEVSSEGTDSWAGRRGCSSAEGYRKSGKSAVPFAVGCTASPAGQGGERGEVQQSPPLPGITCPSPNSNLSPIPQPCAPQSLWST